MRLLEQLAAVTDPAVAAGCCPLAGDRLADLRAGRVPPAELLVSHRLSRELGDYRARRQVRAAGGGRQAAAVPARPLQYPGRTGRLRPGATPAARPGPHDARYEDLYPPPPTCCSRSSMSRRCAPGLPASSSASPALSPTGSFSAHQARGEGMVGNSVDAHLLHPSIPRAMRRFRPSSRGLSDSRPPLAGHGLNHVDRLRRVCPAHQRAPLPRRRACFEWKSS